MPKVSFVSETGRFSSRAAWHECFTRIELVERMEPNEACATIMGAWANCHAGEKIPDSFGRTLIALAARMGRPTATTSDAAYAYAKEMGWVAGDEPQMVETDYAAFEKRLAESYATAVKDHPRCAHFFKRDPHEDRLLKKFNVAEGYAGYWRVRGHANRESKWQRTADRLYARLKKMGCSATLRVKIVKTGRPPYWNARLTENFLVQQNAAIHAALGAPKELLTGEL